MKRYADLIWQDSTLNVYLRVKGARGGKPAWASFTVNTLRVGLSVWGPMVTLQRDLGNCGSQGVGGGCRWDLSDIENEDRQLERGGGGGTAQKPDKIY